MTTEAFDRLLAAARRVHEGNAALRAFCPFPEAPERQPVQPHIIPPAALMQNDRDLTCDDPGLAELRDAFVAAGPQAHWRETYKGSGISQDFMDRFGCYCLVGNGGPFSSPDFAAWVVYMPAGLWYPWHHHPAEEMYLILGGEAEFSRKGHAPEMLRPGDTVLHASSQPHATETRDRPMIAYVVWRNRFDVAPVLTPPDMLG